MKNRAFSAPKFGDIVNAFNPPIRNKTRIGCKILAAGNS